MTYTEIRDAALGLPREERRALSIRIGDSLREEAKRVESMDLTPYRAVMEELVGRSIGTRSRDPLVSHARMIVAREMMIRGFRHERIAELLGRHRSSVIYYRRVIEDMLYSPWQYPDEAYYSEMYSRRLKELDL